MQLLSLYVEWQQNINIICIYCTWLRVVVTLFGELERCKYFLCCTLYTSLSPFARPDLYIYFFFFFFWQICDNPKWNRFYVRAYILACRSNVDLIDGRATAEGRVNNGITATRSTRRDLGSSWLESIIESRPRAYRSIPRAIRPFVPLAPTHHPETPVSDPVKPHVPICLSYVSADRPPVAGSLSTLQR